MAQFISELAVTRSAGETATGVVENQDIAQAAAKNGTRDVIVRAPRPALNPAERSLRRWNAALSPEREMPSLRLWRRWSPRGFDVLCVG
eukprot:2225430-Rhodomonas_salina.1